MPDDLTRRIATVYCGVCFGNCIAPRSRYSLAGSLSSSSRIRPTPLAEKARK
jgi:hypothetical protein